MKATEIQISESYATRIGGDLRIVHVTGRAEGRGPVRFKVVAADSPRGRELKPRTAAALRPLRLLEPNYVGCTDRELQRLSDHANTARVRASVSVKDAWQRVADAVNKVQQ